MSRSVETLSPLTNNRRMSKQQEVKPVFGLPDLQQAAPIFRRRWAAAVGRRLMKWLSIDKVNTIHAKHCHLRGAAFTSAMLADPMMDVRYRVHHPERLDTLPEGAFITVSNHPIGSLDGIILIDLFASRRPDFRVMVNGMLERIWAMADNFISVTPKTGNQTTPNPANVNGVRIALEGLRNGHPIGFFPAGAMSFGTSHGEVLDRPWTHSVIRLIRKSGVPVYPVCFDFRNSPFFYLLGRISWQLRTLRVATEAFNKRGRTADVYVGSPISPQVIHSYTNDTDLANFLYRTTYALPKEG